MEKAKLPIRMNSTNEGQDVALELEKLPISEEMVYGNGQEEKEISEAQETDRGPVRRFYESITQGNMLNKVELQEGASKNTCYEYGRPRL